MAGGFFPLDRGGILRQVTNFPAGVSNDGIFGYIIGGVKYVRTSTSTPTSQEVGIYDNGVDKTARINTVFAHSQVEVIDFVKGQSGNITINGVLTIPEGKVLRIGPGVKFIGTGTINGGTIQAAPNQEIFASTITVNFSRVTGDFVPAAWFGVSESVLDNSVPMNRAIQTIVNSNTLPDKLYITRGTYACTAPIIIYKWNGTVYNQVHLEIVGEDIDNSPAVTRFNFSSKNTFGFGIQLGKGCIIRGIAISGAFQPSIGIKAFTETTYVNFGIEQACREDKYSPYAGVVVDPFGYQLPPSGGGYPTLTTFYRGTVGTANSGSTACRLINCYIGGFICLISYSPNGITQNGDSMQVKDCNLELAKVGLSYGQDQTKNSAVENILCWQLVHTFIDNMKFGTGNGAPPVVRKISFAGSINQMFNLDITGRFGFFAREIFAESNFRIGKIKGAPSTFSDSIFNSIQSQGPTGSADAMGNPDLFLNASNVTFDNVTMKIYDNLFNKRLNMDISNCIFRNCQFDLPPIIQVNPALEIQGSGTNIFQLCKFIQGAPLIGSRTATGAAFLDFADNLVYGTYRNQVKVGNVLYSYNYDNDEYDLAKGVGTLTVTVNETARTATIVGAPFYGFYWKEGDYFYAQNKPAFDDGANIRTQVLGRVLTYVAGSQTVTLAEVPPNVHTGTYIIESLTPIYTGVPFVGNTSPTTNVITNVEGFFPKMGQLVFLYGLRGFVQSVNTGAKTVTMTWDVSGYNSADTVFANGNPDMHIYSTLTPQAAPASTFVIKGTKWHVKELIGLTAEYKERVYVFLKSGYINAAGVSGGIRQAEWYLLEPTKVDASNFFSYFDTATQTWKVDRSSASRIDQITITAGAGSGSILIPIGEMTEQILLKPSASMTIDVGTTALGSEIMDDLDLAANVTTIVDYEKYADAAFSIYFSGIAGGSLVVKILKQNIDAIT